MMTILVAVGVLCGLCGLLALLLVVADCYLNDYGVCRISINSDARQLEVTGGESLLGVLSREKIFIPSACGGRGSCGLCKLKISNGAGPLLPTEEPHLTKAERQSQIRLACQVKVRGDLEIEIPEELFNIREYSATVEALTSLTHDIKLLRLALQEPAKISFVPGQYVQLEAPAYELSPTPVYRAYSIASDTADAGHLDLLIRLVPRGICTTWVFDYLQEGDKVKFNGPYGDFRLHEGEGEMIFIGGGSGMAPFRSILADMKRAGNTRRTRYFFGAQARRDLFLLEQMQDYEGLLADFRFIPALSAPLPDDDWSGETGLITEVVGRHYTSCHGMQAYLCGSPGMIDACIKVLAERGLPADQVFYDKFA